MGMTTSQHRKCASIIHSAAVAAAAGNALPAPGAGVAVDMVVMTTMSLSLAGVFGADITEAGAKAMAIAAFKNAALRQPVRTLTKEVAKFIPGLGQCVAPGISFAMIEAAGWSLAKEMATRSHPKRVA